MNILEKLSQIAKDFPEKTALKVNLQTEGISYANLDLLSGRVLTYLSQKNIGKEDFVSICLPRGTEPLICAVGVLKAGAAFVIIEENYTPERAEYIKKDCNCKLTIDYTVWQEIQHCESATTSVPWDNHAAAFAIYTSGSTGTPKGVVHEYGNLQNIISSTQDGKVQFQSDDRMALIAPLTFIASIQALLGILYAGASLYIVSYSVAKNPNAFYAYLLENCITIVFLPPSVFRAFPNFGPHMRIVLLGGEVAKQVYREDVICVNVYAMSETGAVVCYFIIDKLYDVTPIGTPTIDMGLRLLNEACEPVSAGEIGEICLYLPFVRGYLNRPLENANAFRQDHIFHSGDLAYMQPDGNYMLRGRIDDMIKINGNRIDPGEIEGAVKRVLNLDWVTAKGFVEGNSGFICVYYLQDIEINEEQTRQALLRQLPYYMLPSHFIKIPSIPLNANGKLDRKSLKPPAKNMNQETYVPPTNTLETQLCNAFAKVLKIDRFGIHDDFYKLGGDSLGAITAVTLCETEGLNVSEIFHGRTPEKIAKLWETLISNESDFDSSDALNRSYLLTSEQIYMVDYQFYAPKSTMFNLFLFAKIHKNVDEVRFAAAVSKAIAHHPALLTVLDFNEDGEMIQRYNADFAQSITPEQISEAELEVLKDTLIQPYTIVGNPLYRSRIFKTEQNLYFFFDVHHTVFDGASFQILLRNINALYDGELELPTDSYYQLLAQNARLVASPAFQEGLAYFKKRYDAQGFDLLRPYAIPANENRLDSIELVVPKLQDLRISSDPKQQLISNNVLFLSITALAASHRCKTHDISFSWVYNGRSAAKQLSTAGLLFNMLPLHVKLPGDRLFVDLLEDIADQVNLGIQYSSVHYLSTRMQSQKDYCIYTLYQDKMQRVDQFCGGTVELLPLKNSFAAAQTALDIEIFQSDEETQLMFHFDAEQYEKAFMESLLDIYGKITKKLSDCTALQHLTVNDLIGESN